MKRNITTIKLTAIRTDWRGGHYERFMNETLLLRTARKVGDVEAVNNFVLGRLNDYKERGMVDFVKL
jgi:hypothetical protein